MKDLHYSRIRCVLSQLKSSEVYNFSCKKGLGLRPRTFSQLEYGTPQALKIFVLLPL